MTSLLSYSQNDETALHKAAYYGNVDAIKTLISNGASVDCRNKVSIHIMIVVWKWLQMENSAFIS